MHVFGRLTRLGARLGHYAIAALTAWLAMRAAASLADVRLRAVIGDNMVVQGGQPAPISGGASPERR